MTKHRNQNNQTADLNNYSASASDENGIKVFLKYPPNAAGKSLTIKRRTRPNYQATPTLLGKMDSGQVDLKTCSVDSNFEMRMSINPEI